MPKVQNASIGIYYETEGSGPPVVMVALCYSLAILASSPAR